MKQKKEPLAIVGVSVKFPGLENDIEDMQAFYETLVCNQSIIKKVPPNRWRIEDYYHPDREIPNKTVNQQGGFLSDPYEFDASFFNISAPEARQMDPQHRLFLETAVRALNHANIPLHTLKQSNTGVFCGSSTGDYARLNYKDAIEFNAHTLIGEAGSAAAGRLSHLLNLKGPSMMIDTACSSSFSALFVAAMALRAKQCSIAIVGGVHMNLCPENFIGLTKANMLSASDKCQSFDSNADGFVRSEGCGVIIVKCLSDALRDQDRIYACIKSVVMNQNGNDETPLVAPNLNSQILMQEEALREAFTDASEIDYIETHGSGTRLGDSVEFQAIQAVHQGKHMKNPLVLGAVKSNLGHGIASSGMASLVKVLTALKYEKIPANLHYQSPNSHIQPESIPALFPVQNIPFRKSTQQKRQAQIHNFGFTGTNVALVIEEAENSPIQQTDDLQEKCFVLSAKSERSLQKMLDNFIPFLEKTPENLHDICHTLLHCRDHYKYRYAIIAASKSDLIAQLKTRNFAIKKVKPKEKIREIGPDPQAIYQWYLSDTDFTILSGDTPYNKVELPLYIFDRKYFYHEANSKAFPSEEIAIIGMSCRYPKAESIDDFLQLLERGESGMTDIPIERWDNEKYYDSNPETPGRLYIKQLGFLNNIKQFDADFFKISPREAKFLAPQLRVFLECSFHALEDANLPLSTIKDSKTGVFVGCGTNEYPRLMLGHGLSQEDLSIYFATGNVLNAVPGRVAYAFDFQGPVQAIDTACSSSMTAIHNACLSLQQGECDMAIAGGVNVLLTPDSNITLSKAKMLSPESRCKTFSEDADGYARSEGCGVIVLKRLSTALKDKDTILAVIKGSAVNSDGKGGGFTVPNGVAQEKVISNALARSNLTPKDIDYIEAHGTGTPLADPIEVSAINKIFASSHSREKPLYIGSVKTNIGHTESASGVAGIIKAVLGLQTNQLFKHLNFKKLNPEIDLKNLEIPLKTMPWPKEKKLRAIGVSSFGFTGSNAHTVIQEWRNKEIPKVHRAEQESLLLIATKTQDSLINLIKKYIHFLENTEEDFTNICYTSAICRNHFFYRVAIIASSAKEAAAILRAKEYEVGCIKREKGNAGQSLTLNGLQRAYLDGEIIHWSQYYKGDFKKVRLPLYEFSREEHWFENKEILADVSLPKDWSFQVQWQEKALHKPRQNVQGKTFLFLGHSQVAEQLISAGLTLTEDIRLSNDGVIFAEALNPCSFDIESIIAFQKNTLKKLLNLLKQLQERQAHVPLIVLSQNAIPVLHAKSQNINLANSPLVGFCKTIVLELPQFKTILIDLENTENFSTIIAEIQSNHSNDYDPIVAYRNGKRFIPQWEKISLPDNKISLKKNSRYLISGGTGGLGLICAQALLSSGAGEVVLISRNANTQNLKDFQKKMYLDFPDSSLRTISLDISEREKVQEIITQLNHDGQLKGIIHAAGAAIKSTILNHQEEDIDFLFNAKVKGGWYLHEFTKHIDLDFFVVFSSIASVLGSNLESVYSATNSFLDALIAERRRLHLVGTAIQWGPWGEVGMAKERSQNSVTRNSLISKEMGFTFLKVLLESSQKHISIISPDYLRFMLDFVPKPLSNFHQKIALQLLDEKPQTDVTETSWLIRFSKIAQENKLEYCKEWISDICRSILEVSDAETLDEEEGFFELGFDSILITELAAELKKQLEPPLKIKVNIGFDYPSIIKLAKFIKTELDTHFVAPKLETAKSDLDIAIIGMSCSFPNAPDLTSFEYLLEEGLSGITEIPLERWDNSLYFSSEKNTPGKSYVNHMGLIENIKQFDAHFFGISPREAKFMEPQQRLFLECSHSAIEHANYTKKQLRGSLTGVFAGVGPNEYYAQLEKEGFSSEQLSIYSITGNVLNLIPGRVAYAYDLKGPSIAIDTACSSSLVAIHQACQSLRQQEIDYALAGGVNILLRPESNITLCQANALALDGKCKSFDAQADGYVRSEGCGVVFLKRLSDATRDKDNILAVIKASAVNNDGQSAGLTVPNGGSQADVMAKALRQSGLASQDVHYIEAHGTGTPLGDPIEVHAINRIYGRSSNEPLHIGTVKTNIGHLESASGVAGVIKTVISLQKQTIYKHLNLEQLNPKIVFENTQIATEKKRSKMDCAAVNAFGFSGTNAHVILQHYPALRLPNRSIRFERSLLLLSAKTQKSLDDLKQKYQRFLEESEEHFSDICFTAATCRDHYSFRMGVIAENNLEAAQLLSASREKESDPFLQSVLSDYMAGRKIEWSTLFPKECKKVRLPGYSFDKTEYWIEQRAPLATSHEEGHPLLGQMISMPNQEYVFYNTIDLEALNYIQKHRIFEKITFPGTAFLESGLAAANYLLNTPSFCIENFSIERPFSPKQNNEYQIQIKAKNDEEWLISIFAKVQEEWQSFSQMSLRKNSLDIPFWIDLEVLKSSFLRQLNVNDLLYAKDFQDLQEVYVNNDSMLAKVTLKTESEHYFYHPVLLDGAMQRIVILGTHSAENSLYIPYALTKITTYQKAPKTVWIHLVQQEKKDENELCLDIQLYNNAGLLIATLEGMKLRKVIRSQFLSFEPLQKNLHQIQWIPAKSHSNIRQIPHFLVFASDKNKAQTLLKNISYTFAVDNQYMENSHILFIYEQDQFQALFSCCQALFKTRPKSFTLCTQNAYSITGLETVNPYHTMASSFWKSFKNELAFDQTYTIDLGDNTALLDSLNFVFHPDNSEEMIAFRAHVFIPRLQTVLLEASEELSCKEGSYLITGGSGGLAKLLIRYLVNRGAKRIYLISRNPLSSQQKEELNHYTIDIQHHLIDASNYQQMSEFFQKLDSEKMTMNGIFHLAGVIQDGLIINLNQEKVEQVLSAKMESALILHQLSKNMPLDCFVLFSSIASLLGPKGQSNYVAANGFLDGLAHLRRSQNLPALSINWGPFEDMGMAASFVREFHQHGFILLPEESINILDVLLQSSPTQIAVSPIRWEKYCTQNPQSTWLLNCYQKQEISEPHFLNYLLNQNKEESLILLRQVLRGITAQVLAIENPESIAMDDGLISLGMDSLMAIEIRNKIHDKLQCATLNLSIEYFINSPSLQNMAEYILDELQDLKRVEQQESLELVTHPLSDFQFIFWALNIFNYGFNIGTQVRLHGKLNKEYCRKALELVVQEQEVFWLIFDKKSPLQTLRKSGELQFIENDLTLMEDEKDLNAIFRENVLEIIPLSKTPLMRVYLYKINQNLHELHLLYPHIIVDDTSCEMIFHQFKKYYAMLAKGETVNLPKKTHSFFQYARIQKQYFETNLSEKIHFWRNYNKDFDPLMFKESQYLPNYAQQKQHLFFYELDPNHMDQFASWHKENNRNFSAGLVALCQMAFYQVCQQDKIPIILLQSGREGSSFKSTLGVFAEYKRINIRLKNGDTLEDCIHSIEEEIIRTAPYQKCTHFIRNSGFKSDKKSFVQKCLFLATQRLFKKHLARSVHPQVIDYYLSYLSQLDYKKKMLSFRHKINRLLKRNTPLEKQSGLRTLISIAPGFYLKEKPSNRFADIDYYFASHMGCMDKPSGNQTLWLYFSKNQDGDYLFAINGPITQECKDDLAQRIKANIALFLQQKADEFKDLTQAEGYLYSNEIQ